MGSGPLVHPPLVEIEERLDEAGTLGARAPAGPEPRGPRNRRALAGSRSLLVGAYLGEILRAIAGASWDEDHGVPIGPESYRLSLPGESAIFRCVWRAIA